MTKPLTPTQLRALQERAESLISNLDSGYTPSALMAVGNLLRADVDTLLAEVGWLNARVAKMLPYVRKYGVGGRYMGDPHLVYCGYCKGNWPHDQLEQHIGDCIAEAQP